MPLHDVYNWRDDEQAAVYLKLKAAVEGCFKEGTDLDTTLQATEYLGSRMWPDDVTRRLAANHYVCVRQEKENADHLAKLKAEQASKPAAPITRPVVRSQTIQGKAAATKRYKKAKSPDERRWIPGFPGFRIDARGHVYKPDGTEASYRANQKFQWCARLKDEDGDWPQVNIYDLMVKAGFVEGRYEKRDRKARYTGADAWRNHYETREEAIADGFLDPEEADLQVTPQRRNP